LADNQLLDLLPRGIAALVLRLSVCCVLLFPAVVPLRICALLAASSGNSNRSAGDGRRGMSRIPAAKGLAGY